MSKCAYLYKDVSRQSGNFNARSGGLVVAHVFRVYFVDLGEVIHVFDED